MSEPEDDQGALSGLGLVTIALMPYQASPAQRDQIARAVATRLQGRVVTHREIAAETVACATRLGLTKRRGIAQCLPGHAWYRPFW